MDRIVFGILCGSLLIGGASGYAQLVPQTAEGEDRQPYPLPPVIVRAEPEEPDPSARPLAMTRLGADPVARSALSSIYDLTALAPNFVLSRSVARSFGDVYVVRGIANTQFFSSPAMAVYVDDVPAGDVFTVPTELLEIQRIDVWRGPQPTLFGQNSAGGVLHIVTPPLGDRYEAAASASYARFNSQDYRASLRGPLVPESLGFDLRGRYARSDGFLDNLLLGREQDSQEEFSGRASARWSLAADWDVQGAATYDNANDGVRLAPLTGNPRKFESDITPSADSRANRQSLRIARTFPPIVVTSVTARRQVELDPLFLDLDLSAVPGNTALIKQAQEHWTEELRLQPVAEEGPWTWSSGFFFSTAERDGDDLRQFVVEPFPGFSLPVEERTEYTIGEDNYALFGQVTWRGLEKLAVTAGLRLDYAVRELDRIKTSTLAPIPPVRDDADFFTAAPKLGLEYPISERVLVYGSTGLGFKPGGFSAFINPPRSPEYDTELTWANEIGLKAVAWDGKLTAAFAVFYYDIQDYQVERTVTGSTDLAVFNAPEAHSYGAEIELGLRPWTGWQFSAAFGYCHAEFDRFTDPETGQNLDGKRPAAVPEFNAALAAEYHHPKGWFGRLSYVAVGQTHYDEANAGFFTQDAYSLLEARAGYEVGHYSIHLFGANLTDTDYFARIVPDLAAGVPGTPRTLGVRVSVAF